MISIYPYVSAGVTKCLQELSSLLPMPVYGVQLAKDAPLTSVQQLATFYISVSLFYVNPFHLD